LALPPIREDKTTIMGKWDLLTMKRRPLQHNLPKQKKGGKQLPEGFEMLTNLLLAPEMEEPFRRQFAKEEKKEKEQKKQKQKKGENR
jgi:hypothetical protein